MRASAFPGVTGPSLGLAAGGRGCPRKPADSGADAPPPRAGCERPGSPAAGDARPRATGRGAAAPPRGSAGRRPRCPRGAPAAAGSGAPLPPCRSPAAGSGAPLPPCPPSLPPPSPRRPRGNRRALSEPSASPQRAAGAAPSLAAQGFLPFRKRLKKSQHYVTYQNQLLLNGKALGRCLAVHVPRAYRSKHARGGR